MRLSLLDKKGPVLTRTNFGCLSDVYTVNVTRGCEFQCVYCYARGYSIAPERGHVMLYSNLIPKLQKELDSTRRRYRVKRVAFNTASDSFQRHPGILQVSHEAMKLILERGIALSLLTKGWIPDRFVDLFSKYPDFVSTSIGLVSTSRRYQKTFELGAATPEERLGNIDRLRSAGVRVQVRIDPIIPFYTDYEETIHKLFEELAARGVNRVILSYLHLRPAIFGQLREELSSTAFRLLQSCFETQPVMEVGTSTKTRLCPVQLRKKGYARFKDIGRQYGIACLICACKNPDMPAQLCTSQYRSSKNRQGVPNQLSLFQC